MARTPSFREYVTQTSPYKTLPWHQAALADEIHEVVAGDGRRLMGLIPIQHGKSFLASDRIPSYLLGRNPLSHTLLAAYGASLVGRGVMQNRRIMSSPYWQSTFGWPIGAKDTQSELIMDVPGQDGRFSLVGAPINGSVAGHTVDLAVVDDICRNRADALSPKIRETVSENYHSVIAPRSKKIILVTTPWHQADLSMEIIRQARQNKAAPQWRLMILAATNDDGKDSYVEDTATGVRKYFEPYESLWPEVHPRNELDEIKATLRDSVWQALYMCRPSVGANCLFPRDKWGVLGPCAPIAINWAWDFASGKSGTKNDYTVGCCVALMNTGRYAVLDLFRGKPDFTMMKQLVFEKWSRTYDRYRLFPNIFIEDASAGQQILQEIANFNLRNNSLVRPIPVIPTHSKEMRAEAIASAQNNGQVDLPADALWREEFIRELEEFPLAEHDDQVDAYTWAQAGFVRGEGFFKQPALEPGEGVDVVEYDGLSEYRSSFSQDDDFDATLSEAEHFMRRSYQ